MFDNKTRAWLLPLLSALMLLYAFEAFGRPEGRPAFDFEGDVQGWQPLGHMEANAVKSLVVDGAISTAGYHSLGVNVRWPGEAGVYTYISRDDTSAYEEIALDIYLPENAPEDIACHLFLQDGEWLWYQSRAHSLSPGQWHTISESIAPESMAWESIGHSQPWGPLSRAGLNTFGVKLFSHEEFEGRFNIDNVTFRRITFPHYEINVARPAVGEKFEISFYLPAVYHNPFDPDEVSVTGEFTGPSGDKLTIPGFFYQRYERLPVTNDEGRRFEALEPRGAPEWKIRFTPLEHGTHDYRIVVSDHMGIRSTERRLIEVEEGAPPGFAGIDPESEKGFVLDCGKYFYPIGLNYRSPYDVRYEANILGKRITDPRTACAASNVALDDGSFGYEENMAEMAEHGMNFMETWLAPWWLAIEWSPQRIGFRGAGRYNMRNAWKLDRIMDAAAEHGIYLQLVLINHGQLSTFCDAEWQDHPYNAANGGFLDSPEEVFTDPEAIRLTKNMLRYIIARWGYSPYVFAWDILNEINLVGDSNRFWRSDEIVDWFEKMTLFIKETDPYGHMVTGHFTGNFDSDIFRIEEVDFSANNAYYNVNNQDIVSRLRGTYNFHRRFEKPFIIAEFGGTSGGGTVRNLKRDLQAALWAGYTMPIAASPLFWWHQLVRDQDWFHMYESIAGFERIVGETRRFMDTYQHWSLVYAEPAVEEGDDAPGREGTEPGAGGQMMHCRKKNAYVGWFYNQDYVKNLHEDFVLEEAEGLFLKLSRIKKGEYRLLLWDTQSGEPIEERDITLAPGTAIPLPVFNKDTAIYLESRQ